MQPGLRGVECGALQKGASPATAQWEGHTSTLRTSLKLQRLFPNLCLCEGSLGAGVGNVQAEGSPGILDLFCHFQRDLPC